MTQHEKSSGSVLHHLVFSARSCGRLSYWPTIILLCFLAIPCVSSLQQQDEQYHLQGEIEFSSLDQVGKHYDWDWMNCHHGYYQGENGNRTCICDQGWDGIDCSLCANNKVCSTSTDGGICDRSMIIQGEKAFNCTLLTTTLLNGGSATAQFNFPPTGEPGSGLVSVFRYPTGAPFIFNCTLTDCVKSYDDASTTEQMTCGKTSCECSTWCSPILKSILMQMKDKTLFSCNAGTGVCKFLSTNVPVPIEFGCTAAGCQESPYVPQPSFWTKRVIIAISVGISFFVVLVIGAIILSVYLFRRLRKPVYTPLGQREFSATLSFHNISCTIYNPQQKKSRKVLNSVSGFALPGQLMAIIGPSGSGKTTFIDILAGRKNTGKTEGEILINGIPRDSTFKRLSGYVLQDDKMLGTLTVREHLKYIALLRLPSSLSYEAKMQRVDEVLHDLGIDHIANSYIGTDMSRGISGGERRRLSIASELVTDPAVLMLDEPTSGLDSYTSFSLMQTLKRLAVEKKRTIVVSIHQPRSNIYKMFDQLLVLSHGEMVYFGNTNRALEHFGLLGYESPTNYNPADFLIDLVTMNSVGLVRNLAKSYRDSDAAHSVQATLTNIKEDQYYQQRSDLIKRQSLDREISINGGNPGVVESSNGTATNGTSPSSSHQTIFVRGHHLKDSEIQKEYASSWIMQVWILSRRTFLNNFRNPYLLRTQYVMTVGIALLLGTIYWHLTNDLAGVQNRAGSLFFMISLLSFGSMSSIDIFYHERALFVRERANGMYCTSAYFTSKAICDLIPMRIIPPLILGTIAYPMIGLSPTLSSFFYFLLILVLVSLCASAMCMAISSSTPSLSLGNLVAILLMLFYMLFGGFLVNKVNIPPFVRWLKWLSFLNYGFEVLMVNELINLDIRIKYETEVVVVNGRFVLRNFDMEDSRFGLDLAMLGVMSVFYLGLAYVFLRWLIKEKR